MKRNLIKAFIVYLGFISFPIDAQVLTIFDEADGLPIEYATVLGTKPRLVATTNSQGEAEISGFKNTERIEIRMIGYATLVTTYKELKADRFRAFLATDRLSLETVVVSATRSFEPKSDIPVKVSTITPKQVRLQNPQTAADLLGVSGEVFIQKSQQGGGSPMIRGFATNRLLLTIDGVRMNTAIFRAGNVQNVISIDPFTIENTEVIFGPGSVIYGSDAIGGVMSFYTKDAELAASEKTLFEANATSRYATANQEFTNHFDVNLGWKKFALLVSATHTEYNDLRMGANGPDEYLRPWYVTRGDTADLVITNDDPRAQLPSRYAQDNLLAKARFKPNQRLDLVYTFQYSGTTDYDRYDRLIETRNGQPRSAEWYYGPQLWQMHSLMLKHTSDSKWYDEFNMRLAYQSFEESRNDRRFNSSSLRQRTERVKAYSANLDFVKNLNRHTLFYGAEAVVNTVDSDGKVKDVITGRTNPTSSRYPNSNWSSYAAYVTYQYRLSSKMLLEGGARYNQFLLDADFTKNLSYYPLPFTEASINNGALTGSLGVDYKPINTLTIGAHVSTGFRSPNVDDIGKIFDSEPGAVLVPNPTLQAEYAYNAEIDIAKRFGNFLKVDVAAFYTLLNKAMIRTPFTLNGQDTIIYDGTPSQVLALQNAALASVYGFQAGLDIELPAGFGITSRFNVQRGEEELEDGTTARLRHAAPWFGVTRLSYTFRGLVAEFYAQYSGEVSFENLPPSERSKTQIYAMDENGNPYSPSWYTLNIKALYTFNKHLSVSIGAENLTNIRYRPYSSGLAAPGLNFIFALRLSI